jgi:hypothetical protein
MTPEETRCLDWLIKEIQVEKDQKKFSVLVHELNEILAKKDLRLSDLPYSATHC